MPEIEPFGWQSVPVILKAVAKAFGLEVDDLVGPSRMKTTALARFTAALLARDLCRLSWHELGELFKRDHTTIMYGVKKLERKMKDDHTLLEFIASIRSTLIIKEPDADPDVLNEMKEKYT